MVDDTKKEYNPVAVKRDVLSLLKERQDGGLRFQEIESHLSRGYIPWNRQNFIADIKTLVKDGLVSSDGTVNGDIFSVMRNQYQITEKGLETLTL